MADSLVHRRGARLGTARVRQEMLAKGLDAETVAEAVAGLRASEHLRAREVWRRKFGEVAPDAAARARQMRFLAARGFAPEIIRRVVGGRDETDEAA